MIQADRLAAEKSGQAINLKQAATTEPLPPHKPQMRVGTFYMFRISCVTTLLNVNTGKVTIFEISFGTSQTKA